MNPHIAAGSDARAESATRFARARFMPDILRSLNLVRLPMVVIALLLNSACSSTFSTGGSATQGVDVPEPGGATTRRGTTAAARSTPRAPVPPRVVSRPAGPMQRSMPPASASTTTQPLPLPLPLPGVAAGEDNGLIIEQSVDGGQAEPLRPAAPSLPDFTPAQSHNSAVNTLLAQSDAQRRNGNLDAAIAAAERALRISPDDPTVYYQLAELRLRRGDAALAEQLARKGLSYQPDVELRDKLNAVISQIRVRG